MDLSTSKETSHLHHPGPWDYFLCSTGGEVFPGGSVDKESACSAGNLGSIPGWEDPLEKGMTVHSSILAWRIPWTV